MAKSYLMSPQNTLDILYKIHCDVEELGVKEHGLCNLFLMFHEYSLKDCLNQAGIDWANWPEYSGSNSYPVPATNNRNFYPDTAYHHTRNLWDKSNPYCQGRYRLLDWLIVQLKDVIAKQVNEPPRILPNWTEML